MRFVSKFCKKMEYKILFECFLGYRYFIKFESFDINLTKLCDGITYQEGDKSLIMINDAKNEQCLIKKHMKH